MRETLKWLLPLGTVIVNASLAFCLYVASTIFSYSHLLKTNLAVLAEIGFVVGGIGIGFALYFPRKIGFLTRLHLLAVLTFFNQTCVIAYLVSLLPFGGQVLHRTL